MGAPSASSFSQAETPGTAASSAAASGTRESGESTRLTSSPTTGRQRTDSESSATLYKALPKHRSPRYSSAQCSSRSASVYEDDEWCVLEHEPTVGNGGR